MGSSKYVRLCSSSPPEVPSSSSMDLDLNRNQVLKGQFEVERPPNKRVGGYMASASTCLSHPTNAAAAAAAASPTRGHYRCDSCGSEFQLDYQLWWHWRDHIPIRDRLLCHLCPFVSTNRESLKQVFYFFRERSEPPLKASHICCHINFILFQHQRRCHQTLEGGVACVLCHGAFIAKDRTDLSKHVFRSHMYDKRFHLRPSASSTKLPVAANNSAPPSRIMLLSITS